MNPGLQHLIALQETELKIAVLQKQLSDIPLKIGELEAKQQNLRTEYENSVASAKELANRRRALEGEVDMARSKLSRLREQLMAVKTNKEYTAMLSEIKQAEDNIRAMEDRILELMEQMESDEKDLKRAEAEMKRQCAALQEEIRQTGASTPALEGELTRLLADKTASEAKVNRDLLEQYRKIAQARRGVALAEAKDELCSACHVRIRPQMYADLTRTENIMFCDSCSRILYFRAAGGPEVS